MILSKLRIIITAMLCVAVIITIVLIYLTPSKAVQVDIEDSKDHIMMYFESIESCLKKYNAEIVLDDDNLEERENFCRMSKMYQLDDIYCSIIINNYNGYEKYSIAWSYPHDDDEYHCEILSEIINIISGYSFSKDDIENTISNKAGFRKTIRNKSDLVEGEMLHHYKWIGFNADWGIHYSVNKNNPLYREILCDEIAIGGLTKYGTK